MSKKQRIIEGIADRIRSEFRKHEGLDWALIAAKKIYSSYNIDLLDFPDLTNKHPNNSKASEPLKEGNVKSNIKPNNGKGRQAKPPKPGTPTNGKLIDGRSILGLFNRGNKF
jgi:hypothetical protein